MLTILTTIGVILIALFHIWICILETIFWEKPLGLGIFKLDPDLAHKTAAMAANQGLYNAFLSAGLIWSLFASNPTEAFHLKLFFLGCVAVAGIFGAMTVNKQIFLRQGLPAVITLILLMLSSQEI